jgi:hypothetical protein
MMTAVVSEPEVKDCAPMWTRADGLKEKGKGMGKETKEVPR